MNDRRPMFSTPGWIANHGIFYFLQVLSFYFDRYRQPPWAVLRLDNIPVSPVSDCVLHVIVENKFIYRMDQIKVASPGDVIRLHDSYRFAHGTR